jgi:two-component system cell cycle response regulator
MAITDPLTGLFNRRRFESLLDLEFKKAARYASPLSCMMIDIDHFKSVNDTYGHAAGDSVLKDLALIIQRCIREVDTACRWGGEEFVVLTPMTTRKSALQPAGKILRCVSDYVFANVGDHKITVSIGLADISEQNIDDAGGLIRAADLALYEAKRNGRNRIEPTT